MSDSAEHAYLKFLASDLGCSLKDCSATQLAFYGGCQAGRRLEKETRRIHDDTDKAFEDLSFALAGLGEEPERPWMRALTDWDGTSVIAKIADFAQNKGRKPPRNKACQSDTDREKHNE